MGFKQTAEHRFGKGSFHQIGLVRGQFGNVPEGQWLKFVQDTGFDGWEEASWELDLGRCGDDAGAAAYAKERVDLAKKHGLEIFTVAAHLQGQALGDEPSAKTLQFVGGEGRRGLQGLARQGQQAAAHRPLLRPRRGRQADPPAGDARPAGRRPPGRPPEQAAEPQGRRARLRRLAGPLLEPLVPLPAAARQHRRPRHPRRRARSAWNCWPSASGRSSTCASNTASPSTWNAIRASGPWATWSRPTIT